MRKSSELSVQEQLAKRAEGMLRQLQDISTLGDTESVLDFLFSFLEPYFNPDNEITFEDWSSIIERCCEIAKANNKQIALIRALSESINPDTLTIMQLDFLGPVFDEAIERIESDDKDGSEYLTTAVAWEGGGPFSELPDILRVKLENSMKRIIKRKNNDVRQDGGIPIACPVVPRADTINYLLEQKSNADAVKQINAVRDAAAEYLSWMDEAKITGTRFITRWHHFYHGDSGRKRAQHILHVIAYGEISFVDLQQLVCAAFQQSSRGEHAFSRYLYDRLVGDANHTSRYQAYLKEFAAESDDADYLDDYEQPLSQFEYLKDQANVDPDSIELFKQAIPATEEKPFSVSHRRR